MVYFGHPFSQTHPDRLATMASLHAMEPAPAVRCRVLELGCADGGNLIPMAYQWPDSEFIGVDLSERAIGKAVETAADLGLGNITAHAVSTSSRSAPISGASTTSSPMASIPGCRRAVRAQIMAIFRHNLAPAGVAYVSDNAYPGSHLRDMAREMMLFHVRAIADPQARVDQARALLKALADASDEKELYGFLLHDQWERVRNMPDSRLYHDDLDEEASAFFLTEVVEEAARHGLQYLSDATFSRLSLVAEPESVVRMISQIPETDAVSRNQYLDFIEGTSFRDTLLCHQEVRLRRPIAPACIKNYHVAAYAVAADEGFEPGEAGAARFTTDEGGTISIDHPVSKAALLHLGMIWPQAVGFPELVERACVLLGAAAGSGHQADVEALMTVLFRLVSAGTVTLHLYPPRLTTVVGERPHASLLARKQAMLGPLVTNLRHNAVWLEDETVRQFLVLVDGSRTIEEIVRDLNAPAPADAAGNSQSSRPQVTREDVERNLATMARLGLLIA
jgi:SAM-dependent methyltransferase